MLRLLNFRCSFCSNPLDETQLGKLPSLADLYAHRNVAFVGPGGIGKTHLAQAYGRECCMRGLCVPSSKNRQIRLSNFDTLMLTASGRAGAVAAGPPAA